MHLLEPDLFNTINFVSSGVSCIEQVKNTISRQLPKTKCLPHDTTEQDRPKTKYLPHYTTGQEDRPKTTFLHHDTMGQKDRPKTNILTKLSTFVHT
jgi:hypothetical protein